MTRYEYRMISKNSFLSTFEYVLHLLKSICFLKRSLSILFESAMMYSVMIWNTTILSYQSNNMYTSFDTWE